MAYRSLVNRRDLLRGAATALAGGVTVLLAGCNTDATYSDTDMAKKFLKDQWGITLPHGTTVDRYYSSESDFQGGRDDVYVIDTPEAASSGFWQLDKYNSPLDNDSLAFAKSVLKSSGASFDLSTFRCTEITEDGQDALLSCYDRAAKHFVLFERIF
jgi:hypothetical protein